MRIEIKQSGNFRPVDIHIKVTSQYELDKLHQVLGNLPYEMCDIYFELSKYISDEQIEHYNDNGINYKRTA